MTSQVPIYWLLVHEITTPAALRLLREENVDRVWNPEWIVAVPDHSVPGCGLHAAATY